MTGTDKGVGSMNTFKHLLYCIIFTAAMSWPIFIFLYMANGTAKEILIVFAVIVAISFLVTKGAGL